MIRLCAVVMFLIVALPGMAYAEDQPLFVSIDRGETISLTENAKSVFIANPEIADVQLLSPKTIIVFGKKMGETTLMALGDNNVTLVRRSVHVGLNVVAVQQALTALLPDSKIKVVGVPDGIMLLGTVKDPGASEDARRVASRFLPKDGEIVNHLQILTSNQITIRVRVAEVSRALNRYFGINWDSAFKLSGFAFGMVNGAALAESGPFGLNTNRPGTTTPENTLNFGHQSAGVDLNGFVDALASDGLITVLAEPNLTAMSGETAFFLDGGEYPILIPQSNGQVSIEYKDYGVKLSFTPTLINSGRINIKVRPEVSELTTDGAVTLSSYTVPALKVRRAETTIELASGQSFAIAGMLSNNINQSVSKFPFLGDMPVLGALFRSTSFLRGETELVIIVTPYIVHPADGQLALPTDGMAPPTEVERLVLQRVTSPDPTKKGLTGDPTAVELKPTATPAIPAANGGFIVE